MNRSFWRVIWALLALFPSWVAAEGYRPEGVQPGQTTYIFGVHPYTNPQDMFEAYAPIMRYLEQQLPGSHFQVEASRDYADYEAKLVAGHFHFSLPNPAQAVVSLQHGYRVIAKMTPDEDFQGLFIALKDASPASPQELLGKSLCFTSATALAGTLMPLMWLHDQGVDVKQLKINYVGSQFSAILNAWGGDYQACGSTSRFFRTWSRKNPEKADKLQVLWRTPSLPHNAVVARTDVATEVAEAVAKALVQLDKDPAVDQSQFKLDQHHFERADNSAYQPVEAFLRRYDAVIGLPEQMKLPKAQ